MNKNIYILHFMVLKRNSMFGSPNAKKKKKNSGVTTVSPINF